MALVSFPVDYGHETSISSTAFILQDDFEEVSEIKEEVEKIMSPELALQRERAYAAKMSNIHNEVESSPVSVQESSLSLIIDRAQPPENLSNVLPQPSHLRQTFGVQTLQTQSLENLPHIPPPGLQQAKQTLQVQSSCLPLVPPLNLQKGKQDFESRSSGNLPVILPPHLQKAKQTIQIQSSQNPPYIPLPQPQLQTSRQNFEIPSTGMVHCILSPHMQIAKQTLQIQSSQNPPCIPLPQPQLQISKQNFEIQSTGTLHCAPPPSQLQTSNQTRQIQSSESLSNVSLPQMQQSYTTETLKVQSSENPSRIAPIQMRHPYAKRKSQIQPLSLVCKDCLVVCSSATTLKQHYKGRKHRTRVQELKMQRNILQSSDNQSIAIEPQLKTHGSSDNQSIAIEPLWCDVCRIRCMNEDCLLQHLNGKKHADCVQAINAAKELRQKRGESSSNQRQGRFGVGGNCH